MHQLNRRSFLRAAGAASATTMLGARIHALAAMQEPAKPVSPNDHIQIALIGAGGQGQGDTKVAVQVPGVKLVAVADCYDGRLAHSKELWGDDIFTTRDYNEILARKDIDAVIIGTPDHWHKQASVRRHEGRQRRLLRKAHDSSLLRRPGNDRDRARHTTASSRSAASASVRSSTSRPRNCSQPAPSASSTWSPRAGTATPPWAHGTTPFPLDASPETCDWPRFLGTAPKIPFNAEHFFQWRKWKAYGSGVAGDLFVHLFSGTHFITGSHGPTRGMATGGLRFWNDGRDVPDVMLGLFDYREGFNLSLRVNFVDGGEESEGLIFTGSEGTMEIGGNAVTVSRVPREQAPGYMIDTFTEAMQKQILADYDKKYPRTLRF